MRPLSGIVGFAAAVLLGFGVGQLGLALTGPAAQGATPARIDDALADAARPREAPPPTAWPAAFGRYIPDAPAPAAPPKPKQRYDLVGLVADDDGGWAIVAAKGGNALVRPGDTLVGGERVESIVPEGVWMLRDGKRELIAFEETPQETFARLTGAGKPLQEEVTVPASALAARDIRRVLGRAGSVRMVKANAAQGQMVPEILWVREGQLYELIGLRRGDMVLSVNGLSVSDPETLKKAEKIVSGAGVVDVNVLRHGQRRTIHVTIDTTS